MLGYLSAAINCSEKRTVFLELRSRKTVSYEEQIMSTEKYPSIFSRQMATIVYIYLGKQHTKNGRYFNFRDICDQSLWDTVTYGRHSLRYMGPYIWSKLHKSIKMADSLIAFKNQVRALDLSNVMSKNNCKNCKLCKT